MGMRNEFNFLGANPVKIRSSKYLNNYGGARSPARKIPYLSQAGFSLFPERPHGDGWYRTQAELIKGQYGVPFGFGWCSRDIWRHVLAA